MTSKPIDITILCKVVDNFGDIGVTWRLAKHLSEHRNVTLRLVCDDIASFSKINSRIDSQKAFQECNGIKIYDWNDYAFCYDEFTKAPPEIILECFQCGRPGWLEKILFDDQKNESPTERGIWNDENRLVNIIMIDYLSAEKYQEDFHCLKSLTRSAKVPKINFMPGYTNKTGGLLLPCNGCFSSVQANFDDAKTKFQETPKNPVKILFFAYKNDWTSVVRAIDRDFGSNANVLVASGQGQESILGACEKCSAKFHPTPLPYMNQEKWDELMRDCDLLFIRGEDSLAQACLTGTPFIWQAYPQSEDYQTVKVKALLERMKPHFGEEFLIVEKAWMAVNSPTDGETDSFGDRTESAMHEFFSSADSLRAGFSSFAQSLYKNGDLAHNLMTFIEKNIIIHSRSL